MSGDQARGRCDVDCEAGRRLGCRTFCCRLLVRLDPEEREPGDGVTAPKGFIDKDPVTGLCVHFDEHNSLCRIWERRPRVCREYSCNPDSLLQVVLRHGFTSLAALLRTSAKVSIPKAMHVQIPYLGDGGQPGAAVQGCTGYGLDGDQPPSSMSEADPAAGTARRAG